MEGEKWIIVDTKPDAGAPDRYFGPFGWAMKLSDTTPFWSRESAQQWLKSMESDAPRVAKRCRVRRIVPAGTRRNARIESAEANVATLRAQLDGLQATDEASAMALADALAERDRAIAALAEVEVERDRLAMRVAELQRLLSPEVAAAE